MMNQDDSGLDSCASCTPRVPSPYRRPGPPPLEETPRFKPVEIPIPETDLHKNLEKYREMALDLGADDAVIVPTSQIPQDIRAYYKCAFPRCYWFGTNAMCPPHWKTPWEEAKLIMRSFRYAIVHRAKVDPNTWTGPKYQRGALGKFNKLFNTENIRSEELLPPGPIFRPTNSNAVSVKIEQQAYYDGYPFAWCLGAGSCLQAFCEEFGACQALRNHHCRFPGKARPEGAPALYIDYVGLCRNLGWKIVEGGYSAWGEDVPNSMGCYSIGMTFID